MHHHGDPVDVLTLDDVEAPQPAAGQVAVDVAAAGVNFADILLCQGSYQEKPPLPFTPGLELA
ncbi:MAG: NADPH:quinone reductase, partial [Acidimicrobiaceae bacterium]